MTILGGGGVSKIHLNAGDIEIDSDTGKNVIINGVSFVNKGSTTYATAGGPTYAEANALLAAVGDYGYFTLAGCPTYKMFRVSVAGSDLSDFQVSIHEDSFVDLGKEEGALFFYDFSDDTNLSLTGNDIDGATNLTPYADGYDLAQATASRRPLNTGTINGVQAADFTYSNSESLFAALLTQGGGGVGKGEIAFVFSMDTSISRPYEIFSLYLDASNYSALQYDGANDRLKINNYIGGVMHASASHTIVMAASTPYLCILWCDGLGVHALINGVYYKCVNSSGPAWFFGANIQPTQLCIGDRFDGGGSGMNGKLGMIHYMNNKIRTNEQRLIVQRQLALQFGITLP